MAGNHRSIQTGEAHLGDDDVQSCRRLRHTRPAWVGSRVVTGAPPPSRRCILTTLIEANAQLNESAERLVVVCSKCRRASCWHGYFYCDEYKGSGVASIQVQVLARLKLEDPSWWEMDPTTR